MMRLRSYTKTCMVLLLLMGISFGLGYLMFWQGQQEEGQRAGSVPIVSTVTVRDTPPLQPFAGLDPALSSALLNSNPVSGLDFSVADVPQIGVYVPAITVDGVQLELERRPELVLSPLNNELLSSFDQIEVVSDALGQAAIFDYGGDECAPGGLPATGVLTQRYHTYHTGIDIGVPLGTPVQATHSGTVDFAGWDVYGYGYLVVIKNGTFITYYAHLTNFNVKTGDKIGMGSVIAWSGSTGNSTGPHIHYETRINDVTVDPLTFAQRNLESC